MSKCDKIITLKNGCTSKFKYKYVYHYPWFTFFLLLMKTIMVVKTNSKLTSRGLSIASVMCQEIHSKVPSLQDICKLTRTILLYIRCRYISCVHFFKQACYMVYTTQIGLSAAVLLNSIVWNRYTLLIIFIFICENKNIMDIFMNIYQNNENKLTIWRF